MDNVFMGIISYLGPEVAFRQERIKMHYKQLVEIQYSFQQMNSEHGEDPIPITRIEEDWDDSLKEQLNLKELPITSVATNKITPGAARNILLRELYNSDKDWLICMDDDHWVYQKYDGYKLFWELGKGNFDELARQAIAFSVFPAYWFGFQKEVDTWGKVNTHWLFLKTRHAGAMPLCCIPNLKKYGYPEVYFNEETDCFQKESAPEDLQFYLDWIVNGGKWMESLCLIAHSEGDLDHSSLFCTPEARKERDRWVKDHWRPAYLRSKYPNQPRLWGFREFSRRKNPSTKLEVERFWRYE